MQSGNVNCPIILETCIVPSIRHIVWRIMKIFPDVAKVIVFKKALFTWSDYKRAMILYWKRVKLKKICKQYRLTVQKELQIIPLILQDAKFHGTNWLFGETKKYWPSQTERTVNFCNQNSVCHVPVCIQALIIRFQNKT